jgi:hypothetical protein
MLMLKILGSNNRFCDGISRRDFLQIGGLGAAGLTLPQLFRARAASVDRPRAASRAKSCILLFMYGGPPQIDTFDLKPEAPAEVRGELKPIETNVPGIRISESLPHLAKHADKFTVVRSVSTNQFSGAHGGSVYLTLTGGHHNPRVGLLDDVKPARDDFPNLGAIVSRYRTANRQIPPFVWLLDMYRSTFAGEGAGFLGKRYDPFRILQDPSRPNFRIDSLELPKDMASERLHDRRELLERVNRAAESERRSASGNGLDVHYEKAFNLLGSAQTHKAFDLQAESVATRDRYGRHKFGQGVLLARRLVEHGVPLVTVFWGGQECAAGGWDLHGNAYANLKKLLPPTDQAFSALLHDLGERGLLDETLVVCVGEFGRAPLIEPNGGRSHWGKCYSAVLAGGGVKGGQVFGKSDRHAAVPMENPVSPGDLIASIYHSLGIDPATEIIDHLGRPLRICQGDAIPGLFR